MVFDGRFPKALSGHGKDLVQFICSTLKMADVCGCLPYILDLQGEIEILILE